MKPIIASILDTDLYKLTMQHAVLQKFPDLWVEFSFTDRNNQVYPKGFDLLLRQAIEMMRDIKLTNTEADYLRKIDFLPPSYVDFLKGFRFNPDEISIRQNSFGHLSVKAEGYWYRTILWEVPILAIISELFFKETFSDYGKNLHFLDLYDLKKLQLMEEHNAYFSDFGTRRRFSYENQDRLIGLFTVNKTTDCFVGTSNVHFAMKHGIKAIGTMAHEWIMAHGALFGYRMGNKLALDNWSDVYGGNLGTSLTDTYTTDSFLKSFDMMHSKLWDGCRQDSGNPFDYVDKILYHYKNLHIDPMSKTIIFSNALDIDTAIKIKEYCVGKIKSAFGIGTHLTNDVGVKPMNIVIKLSGVFINKEWISTVKLSDDLGKNMGDSDELNLCKGMLRIK